MSHNLRLTMYLLAALLLIGLLGVGPQAWATPGQIGPHQGGTIPTVTPRGSQPPTAPPPPPPPTAPPPTLAPPAATLAPAAPTLLPTLTPTPDAAAFLAAALEASAVQVWPAASVRLTLTLTNRGAQPITQILVLSTLPDGLDAGPLPPGSSLVWEGRTLRGQIASLAPGERWTASFGVTVQRNAPAGRVLLGRAAVFVAGRAATNASVALALPPAELPPTGIETHQAPGTSEVPGAWRAIFRTVAHGENVAQDGILRYVPHSAVSG